MKPGWQTSEFWLTTAAMIGDTMLPVAQAAGPKTQLAVAGLLAASYTFARAFTKTKAR